MILSNLKNYVSAIIFYINSTEIVEFVQIHLFFLLHSMHTYKHTSTSLFFFLVSTLELEISLSHFPFSTTIREHGRKTKKNKKIKGKNVNGN